MRLTFIPLALATAIGLSGAALAATTTEGTLKAVDLTARSVTLADGTVYFFPDTRSDHPADLAGFRVGDKVVVVWDMIGGRHEAEAIHAADS